MNLRKIVKPMIDCECGVSVGLNLSGPKPVRKRTPAAYAGIVPTTSSSVGDLSSCVTSNCIVSKLI
jgi:hypothetical protein